MTVLQQGADHQHHGGKEDKEEWDEGHNPGPEAEVGVLEQIPPPLLGPANTSVVENMPRFAHHLTLLNMLFLSGDLIFVILSLSTGRD